MRLRLKSRYTEYVVKTRAGCVRNYLPAQAGSRYHSLIFGMGKKRIIKQREAGSGEAGSAVARKKVKRRVTHGFAYINSTYNNTIVTLTDETGAVLSSGSAGSLGFSGAKKGTPYAASKVAIQLAERAQAFGMQDIGIYVRGIGAGRESAIRSLAAGGLIITMIKDITPVAFNGPKPPKVRRV